MQDDLHLILLNSFCIIDRNNQISIFIIKLTIIIALICHELIND